MDDNGSIVLEMCLITPILVCRVCGDEHVVYSV